MKNEDEILTGILVEELARALLSDRGVKVTGKESFPVTDDIRSNEELNYALDRFCEILSAELGEAEFAEAEALISRVGRYEDKTWARGEAA